MRKKRVSSENVVGSKIVETSSVSAEIVKEQEAFVIQEVTETRRSKGLSQNKLQTASGVEQSVIARIEIGETDPKLSTIIRMLIPLGMTLAVVPLYTKHNGSH